MGRWGLFDIGFIKKGNWLGRQKAEPTLRVPVVGLREYVEWLNFTKI